MDFMEQECDALDASVFSGDSLESLDNRKSLRAFCERWIRALDAREAEIEAGPPAVEVTP